MARKAMVSAPRLRVLHVSNAAQVVMMVTMLATSHATRVDVSMDVALCNKGFSAAVAAATLLADVVHPMMWAIAACSTASSLLTMYAIHHADRLRSEYQHRLLSVAACMAGMQHALSWTMQLVWTRDAVVRATQAECGAVPAPPVQVSGVAALVRVNTAFTVASAIYFVAVTMQARWTGRSARAARAARGIIAAVPSPYSQSIHTAADTAGHAAELLVRSKSNYSIRSNTSVNMLACDWSPRSSNVSETRAA